MRAELNEVLYDSQTRGVESLGPQTVEIVEDPAVAKVEAELEEIAQELEDALVGRCLPDFFAFLRETSLPYLFVSFRNDQRELFSQCSKVLHRLGSLSPAVALAFENHLYLACGLATLPVGENEELADKRDRLVQRLVDERLLLVNTNSYVHGKKPRSMGTYGVRRDGGYLVRGAAAYLSMATEGDLLFFSTLVDDDEFTIFVVDLKENPSVEIGDYTFPNSMIDSDTRRVKFHDLALGEEHVLLSSRDIERFDFLKYTHSWHQSLLAALYLGAASGALEEVRRMARDLQAPEGGSLAERDGLIADVGRLAIDHRAACCLVDRVGEGLAKLSKCGLHAISGLLEDTLDLASAAKYKGTLCAEEVVTRMRHVIGGRGFVGGQQIERLTQEVIFGVLGPDSNQEIIRKHGKAVLGERPFLGWSDV